MYHLRVYDFEVHDFVESLLTVQEWLMKWIITFHDTVDGAYAYRAVW